MIIMLQLLYTYKLCTRSSLTISSHTEPSLSHALDKMTFTRVTQVSEQVKANSLAPTSAMPSNLLRFTVQVEANDFVCSLD